MTAPATATTKMSRIIHTGNPPSSSGSTGAVVAVGAGGALVAVGTGVGASVGSGVAVGVGVAVAVGIGVAVGSGLGVGIAVGVGVGVAVGVGAGGSITTMPPPRPSPGVVGCGCDGVPTLMLEMPPTLVSLRSLSLNTPKKV